MHGIDRYRKKEQRRARTMRVATILVVCVLVATVVFAYLGAVDRFASVEYHPGSDASSSATLVPARPQLDLALYEEKLRHVSHLSSTSPLYVEATTTPSSTPKRRKWPVETPPPKYGAILPFHRIVAFYGNFYAKGMGILGQNDATTTRAKLLAKTAKWTAADPAIPAIPAVDYIAVTAQEHAGFDGKYRARMPGVEIQKAIALAETMKDGIVILDVQVGLSTVETEIPLLKEFLAHPKVHLAIDPEFSMKTGKRPGTVIGSFDAKDINFTIDYLAEIVREHDLPPKVLVIHRFTEDMVTNSERIRPRPEVQVVMDMDGWGTPERKIGTYQRFIASQPVQFTGFKLFYKNDLFAPSKRLLSEKEIIDLTPSPLFIQYQ